MASQEPSAPSSDLTAVEYIYLLRALEPDASGRVHGDLPTGGFLKRTWIVSPTVGASFAIHEMVRVPGYESLSVPAGSQVLLRESVIPDWRRIELRAGLGAAVAIPSLARWNKEVIKRALVEVARACVDLGYQPRLYRAGTDLVQPLETTRLRGSDIIGDSRLIVQHRRRTRRMRFQIELGNQVAMVAQRICSALGLPPSLRTWVQQVFYDGPGDRVAVHFLKTSGIVESSPFFSLALRLDPQRWGPNVYQPGDWLPPMAEDHLIPKPYDFVLRGNIRLFGAAGFVALGPWFTDVRVNPMLGPARLRKLRNPTLCMGDLDGRWGMRLAQGWKGNAPGATDADLQQLLSVEGDFLILGNLEYFGSRKLRAVGATLRRVWETEGPGDYIMRRGRPALGQSLADRLLEELTGIAQGTFEHP